MTMLFPTDWREAMQTEVSPAIDDAFGECVWVTPVEPGKPNFPAVPCPDRKVRVRAVYVAKATAVAFGEGRRMGNHDAYPLVSTRKPVFSFGYGVLPWPLTQGCRIARDNGEVFEVTDPRPDSVSRVEVDVVQLGRQKDDYYGNG
ncbi:hypothetical protein V5279_22590 [Bradyrhizobium sp. 26S5]|uniref:hypothetical protein n=1 Tax=Bradyrhizobium sp. 26S5 TaxID=3139729 RepID=UPI0030D5B671